MIETPRLVLRRWREADRAAFHALHADPQVMHDYGAPLSSDEADAKFDRYLAHFAEREVGRWMLERKADGAPLGYTGIMALRPDHPLGTGVEIGWRLFRPAWGFGYASEAATAALRDGFDRLGFEEILAFTASDNARSEAVMQKLGMTRDPARDWTTLNTRFVVYVAHAPAQ